jgi:hypothetical protein
MHCGRGGVCNFVPVGNTNRYKITVLCQVGWPVLNDVAFSTGQSIPGKRLVLNWQNARY